MIKKVVFLLLSIFLVACQPTHLTFPGNMVDDWKYGDLRLLDPVDTVEPDQDLIALYTRTQGQSFQIRLDFLDLDILRRQDVFIAIDTNPGGVNQIRTSTNYSLPVEIYWDYLIIIPAKGNVTVLDTHLSFVAGMALLITRDFTQDNVVVSFSDNTLPISYLTKLQ